MRALHIAFVAILLLAGGLLSPGCWRSETLPFAAETDEPHYQRGKQLQRAGRVQEALDSFLQVINKRGGEAPESHFECGLIYLQHVKDPVAAIYHLRSYLAAQRADSPQATRTRELIDTAMKEFARTLPAQPFEGQTKLLDLMEQVDQLTRENYQLKEQIAQMRGLPTAPRTAPPPAHVAEEEPAAVAPEPEASPAVPAPVPPRPARPAVNAASPTRTAPAAGATGRVHIVQKGDSLFGISRRYYGNGSRVNDIVAANPGVLQDRNSPLRPGMQIKLP